MMKVILSFMIAVLSCLYVSSCVSSRNIEYDFGHNVNEIIHFQFDDRLNDKFPNPLIVINGEDYGTLVILHTYRILPEETEEIVKRTNRYFVSKNKKIPIIFWNDSKTIKKPQIPLGGYGIRINFQGEIIGEGDSM